MRCLQAEPSRPTLPPSTESWELCRSAGVASPSSEVVVRCRLHRLGVKLSGRTGLVPVDRVGGGGARRKLLA